MIRVYAIVHLHVMMHADFEDRKERPALYKYARPDYNVVDPKEGIRMQSVTYE